MIDKLCIRKSDGTVWEPSYSDDYGESQAFADCLLGKQSFFFRRVVHKRVGWWIFKRWKWVRTGEIWEPASGEFDVVEASDLPLTTPCQVANNAG